MSDHRERLTSELVQSSRAFAGDPVCTSEARKMGRKVLDAAPNCTLSASPETQRVSGECLPARGAIQHWKYERDQEFHVSSEDFEEKSLVPLLSPDQAEVYKCKFHYLWSGDLLILFLQWIGSTFPFFVAEPKRAAIEELPSSFFSLFDSICEKLQSKVIVNREAFV